MSDFIPDAPAATAVTMPFFADARELDRSDTAPDIGPRAPFTFASTLFTTVPSVGIMLEVRFDTPVLKLDISFVTVLATFDVVDVIGFTT